MPLSAHERDAAAACLASGGEGAAAAAKALPGGRGTRPGARPAICPGHVRQALLAGWVEAAAAAERGARRGDHATCPRHVHVRDASTVRPCRRRAAWLAFYREE